MRAYAVKIFCEPVELVEPEDVQPSGTEVVVDVTRCGVCHSDLHLQDGYYDLGGGKRLELADRGVKPPVIMGHEVLGRLAAKGPDAPIDDGEIGKTFLVYPWLGCGECELCLRGDENMCPKPSYVGVFRPGGYAEQCLIPHPKYLVDVTGIDPGLAATYACSGVTAYSALRKIEIDKEKDLLVLIGLGGVGMSGLSIARGLGYRNIVAADIDPAKRELALRFGAKQAVDPREPDVVAQLAGSPGDGEFRRQNPAQGRGLRRRWALWRRFHDPDAFPRPARDHPARLACGKPAGAARIDRSREDGRGRSHAGRGGALRFGQRRALAAARGQGERASGSGTELRPFAPEYST
jgi:D-arabinose 1-dehydrogenase-like Zn-dependent alcohol dehydrogenase